MLNWLQSNPKWYCPLHTKLILVLKWIFFLIILSKKNWLIDQATIKIFLPVKLLILPEISLTHNSSNWRKYTTSIKFSYPYPYTTYPAKQNHTVRDTVRSFSGERIQVIRQELIDLNLWRLNYLITNKTKQTEGLVQIQHKVDQLILR